MVLGAVIGALGSLGGGLLGANAADKAAQYNYQVDMLNYYARERERKDAMRMAGEVQRDQKLGGTDAQGNRSYFDPQRGWVVELADGSQRVLDAQQAEQERTLREDVPLRSASLQRNANRQREEDYVAGGLLDEFKRIRPVETQDVENKLVGAQAEPINRGYDQALETIARKGLRTGASNTGKVMEDVNRQRSGSLRDMFVNARVAAPDMARQATTGKRQDIGNLYNMFAERASRTPGVSYQPQNIDGTSNAMMTTMAQRAAQGDSAVINTAGKAGGEANFIEPNYGWANAIGGGATAFGTALERNDAQKRDDEMNKMFMAYLTQGGRVDLNQGGSISRLLQSGGVF